MICDMQADYFKSVSFDYKEIIMSIAGVQTDMRLFLCLSDVFPFYFDGKTEKRLHALDNYFSKAL